VKCKNCKGTGRVSNPNAGNCESQYVDCPKCNGTGIIQESMSTKKEVIDKVTAFVKDKYDGDWKKAFDTEDTDNDGKVNQDELCVILAKSGVGMSLSRWAIAIQIINVMDTDGDGLINWDEFEKMIDMQ
jgi:Ca2+-binding EF-hand superfamily protein